MINSLNNPSLYILLILTVSLGFMTSCDLEVYEPDHGRPEVSLTYPPELAVVPASGITLRAEAADSLGISHVEFFIDHDSLFADSTAPFEALWIPDSMDLKLASLHTIFAVAYDLSGNQNISSFSSVYNGWRSVYTDPDEKVIGNLGNMYIRSSTETLEFRIETFEPWGGAADSSSLHAATFIDVDQDTLTGLFHNIASPDTMPSVFLQSPPEYPLTDIGADYMILVGYEESGLYSWGGSDSTWHYMNDLNSRNIADSTSEGNFSILRASLQNPDEINFKMAIINHGFEDLWDWSPVTLFNSYSLDGRFLDSE